MYYGHENLYFRKNNRFILFRFLYLLSSSANRILITPVIYRVSTSTCYKVRDDKLQTWLPQELDQGGNILSWIRKMDRTEVRMSVQRSVPFPAHFSISCFVCGFCLFNPEIQCLCLI
jgi:hypothetical protein